MSKSPHFWWIISVMTTTIVALAAFIITQLVVHSDTLMEYVAVCSTILSITLSIFAIQYTYTSNNEVQHQFEKINSVADSLKSATENMHATHALLNNNLEQIHRALQSLETSQRDLTSQISNNLVNSGADLNLRKSN